ncbi:hypothetical protein GIY23_13805 [Allosaccharopolyspora coralli]|uniref:Uncharacterized protein n=1 Tax=Allosaccharopolyspora coralli TaxID=2665642 RepID=A0A5Q3QAR3_9PSEU|nr:hypothetical protein [Allosaccharopolyspora coralli]QGK70456.1 hypothetical protein GIY23_13805 [Allosaccharopolyspora coralli]
MPAFGGRGRRDGRVPDHLRSAVVLAVRAAGVAWSRVRTAPQVAGGVFVGIAAGGGLFALLV